MQNVSYFIILIFIVIVVIFALINKVDAYQSFLLGAKEVMPLGIKIFPILLLMYTTVRIFKASGILYDLISLKKIPSNLLVQGIFRPVSSQASLAMMCDTMEEYGPDSKEGIASGILQGGNDTTIYVMSLYFSSINIKKTRYAYAVGLLGDLLCLVMTILIFLLFL